MKAAKKTRKNGGENVRSTTELDEHIGMRIRQARISMGITQEQLGQLLGVSFQQVQKYEKGTNRTSPLRLVTMAEALKVDPNYLLGWSEHAVDTKQAEMNAATIRLAVSLDKLSPDAKGLLQMLSSAMIRVGFGDQ